MSARAKKGETPVYWANLLKELRRVRNVSQVELARKLGINQASVSRWERGLAEPHFDVRRTLDRMARETGLAVLDDVVTVVQSSPFPMILVDRNARVIAASKCSGFRTDRTLEEQTPPDERGHLNDFRATLAREGFWEHRCPSFDYEAYVDRQVRRAVVTAISVRGEVYGLVQKAW